MLTFACGDGEPNSGEVCDDHNAVDMDGCSGDCLVQDTSYVCKEGEPARFSASVAMAASMAVRRVTTARPRRLMATAAIKAARRKAGWECSKPGQPCKKLPQRGNAINDGVNSGKYGECAPGCVDGPCLR